MSELNKLQSNLKKLLKDKHSEYKTVEEAVKALESIPQLGAEISKMVAMRDRAKSEANKSVEDMEKAKDLAIAKEAHYKEELADLEKAIEELRKSARSKMDELKAQIKSQEDEMKKSLAEKRKVHSQAMSDLDFEHREKVADYKAQEDTLQVAVGNWQGKLHAVQAEYKEFKERL